MKASLEAESGWRRAVVTGGEGPSGDFREPGIRVAPHPWVPASAGTTVWRGFRIKSGDRGMGARTGYFEGKGLPSLWGWLAIRPPGQGMSTVRATLPAARSSNASLTSSRGLCRVTNSSSFSLPPR